MGFMQQIKFKTLTEETLESLEKSVNSFLKSQECNGYKLLNITIKQIEERAFPHNDEDFNAILTLVTEA